MKKSGELSHWKPSAFVYPNAHRNRNLFFSDAFFYWYKWEKYGTIHLDAAVVNRAMESVSLD